MFFHFTLCFHYLCRVWSRIILFLSGFGLETEYEEKLDPAKAYIICPNHVSYVDIPLTFAVIPSVFVFVGKKSLFFLLAPIGAAVRQEGRLLRWFGI